LFLKRRKCHLSSTLKALVVYLKAAPVTNIRQILIKIISLALLLVGIASLSTAESPPAPKAVLMTINGAIGPATADYLKRGITQAAEQNAKLAIIQLDTPGGLDKSMRTIIKAIIASKVPVATYVAPSGARAASAGTFILYASHIAAMAPGTNLGAASPVSVGGGMPSPNKKDKKDKAAQQKSTLEKKVSNDAIAYIRSLAQLRNRNVRFAELAVKDAATLTAVEAKQQNVIDYVATDLNDLLKQINGVTLKLGDASVKLDTSNIQIVKIDPDWRARFLAVITDPSVAYFLLLLGIYGLFFEFANPGFIVPGVVGAISLILALYAFQLLPINYAGLGLLLLGIIFMVAEAFAPSFGALGFGGVIAFIVGSILLFDSSLPAYQLAWPVIIGMALVNAAFFFFVISVAIRARTRAVVTGQEDLLGRTGILLEALKDQAQAQIHGEIWIVKSSVPLKKGQAIKVIKVDGLILTVEKDKE
jgi:membrane-bound serine protease (ClpP class)